MIHIQLGSQSSLKRAAVDVALKNIGLSGVTVTEVAVASGVNAQPEGGEETFRGAENRARSARATRGSHCWGLGIENGIVQVNSEWYDFAAIVLIDTRGRVYRAESSAVHFPAAWVEEARRRGFATTTAGAVIAEKTGCDQHDPHLFITQGQIGRKDLLIESLNTLLQHLL